MRTTCNDPSLTRSSTGSSPCNWTMPILSPLASSATSSAGRSTNTPTADMEAGSAQRSPQPVPVQRTAAIPDGNSARSIERPARRTQSLRRRASSRKSSRGPRAVPPAEFEKRRTIRRMCATGHASVRRCGTGDASVRTGVPQPTPHFSRNESLNFCSALTPTSRSTSLPSLKKMTVGIAITRWLGGDLLVLVAIHFANLDFAVVVWRQAFQWSA